MDFSRMKLYTKGNSTTTIIIIIVAALLIWGIIGAIAARDPGVTCDMGLGNLLCWKWHTNLVGQVSQFLNKLG